MELVQMGEEGFLYSHQQFGLVGFTERPLKSKTAIKQET